MTPTIETAGTKKVLVVVKKKKQPSKMAVVSSSKKLQRAATTATARPPPTAQPRPGGGRQRRVGLPSTTRIPAASHQHEEKESDKNQDASLWNDDDGDDQELPNDALLILQSLTSNETTSIPISRSPNTAEWSIRAVLPSQVSQKCAPELLEQVVEARQVLVLQAAGGGVSNSGRQNFLLPQVLMTQDAYCQAAQAAFQRNSADNSSVVNTELLCQWFLAHVIQNDTDVGSKRQHAHFTSSGVMLISKDNVQATMKTLGKLHVVSGDTSATSSSLEAVLRDLVHVHQVLLPCRSNLPSSTIKQEQYQLWLPDWGLVQREWNQQCRQVIQILQRTRPSRERSLQSLLTSTTATTKSNQSKNSSSPTIPRQVIVEWMIQQGIVQRLERPFGTFIKLLV